MFPAKGIASDPKVGLLVSEKKPSAIEILHITQYGRTLQQGDSFQAPSSKSAVESTCQKRKRGKDVKKRKAKSCYRCKLNGQGQLAVKCPGRGNRNLCQYFDTAGNKLYPPDVYFSS